MDQIFVFAQIIGACATVLSVAAWQIKNPRYIIFACVPIGVLWCLQFVMLGASIGATTSGAITLKDAAIAFAKDRYVPVILIIAIAAITGIGLYNFQQWYDALPILASTILNLSYLRRNNRALISRANIATQLLWLAYSYIVHSYMALIAGLLIIASTVIGMARHEQWEIGKCYKSFTPSVMRALFVFPNFRTYP